MPKIVVVGSANVDLTTFTDQFPCPGETIFARDFNLGFGGKGANQAVAARLCGADVTMIARVGDDLFGGATVQNFKSYGIDTTYVRITLGISTGVAPIFVDSSGQNRILVVKGANDLLKPADIDPEVIRQADMVILQLEIPLETVYHTLRLARSLNVRSILNPAPSQPLDFHEIAQADYIIPNEIEAEALKGGSFRNLIVTLGENGARQGEKHYPAHKVNPVDTTGAGDAFIGSFATFLAEGLSESESIRRANIYAALSTQSIGTQKSFPTRPAFEVHLRASA